MKRKISILLSMHNASIFISETINSIINQTYQNWELLIVDDCSSDDSVEIVNQLSRNEPRIMLYKMDRNVGKGIALNVLIPKITGDYIAFIDADDIWIKNKLEKQIKFMELNKCKFSFTAYTLFDSDTEEDMKTIHAEKVVTYKKMLKYSRIGFSTVMINQDIFKGVVIPPLKKRQDYALWLLLLKRTDALGININYTRYRKSQKSLSKNKLDMLKWNWLVYRKSEKLNMIKSIYYLSWDIISKITGLK